MSAHCDHRCEDGNPPADARYRRMLWIVLTINATMFAVEVVSGLSSRSVSLLADSLDFLGDAANIGLSLFVLNMALRWRARASLLKAATMGLFALWIIGNVVYNAAFAVVPDATVMGGISVLALAANVGSALLLYRYRGGDSNMRSVWLCTRNDAIGNIAVMAAALGVFGTASGWPDLTVAVVMAGLAIWATVQVARQALGELRSGVAARGAA